MISAMLSAAIILAEKSVAIKDDSTNSSINGTAKKTSGVAIPKITQKVEVALLARANRQKNI